MIFYTGVTKNDGTRTRRLMTKEQAEFIREALTDGVEDVELKEEYRGRGMARPTYGVTFKGGLCEVVEALLNHCANIDPEEIPQFRSLRSDNIGLGAILY